MDLGPIFLIASKGRGEEESRGEAQKAGLKPRGHIHGPAAYLYGGGLGGSGGGTCGGGLQRPCNQPCQWLNKEQSLAGRQ